MAAGAAGWSARPGQSPNLIARPDNWSWGRADGVHCVQGLLNIGEAMSPPVIAAVKDAAPDVDHPGDRFTSGYVLSGH